MEYGDQDTNELHDEFGFALRVLIILAAIYALSCPLG